MAEKYELDINIGQESDSSAEIVRETRSSRDRTGGTFARPRTRQRRFSMDLFDGLKDKLGEDAYNRTLKSTGNKDKASKSRFAVGYGINVFTQVTSDLITTTASNIGTFTSNQATQNAVDNASKVVTDSLSTVGTIGAAAAAGGPWAAVAATALVAANKAIEIGTASMKLAKENTKRNEDSNRIRNRLGYIESGYSR